LPGPVVLTTPDRFFDAWHAVREHGVEAIVRKDDVAICVADAVLSVMRDEDHFSLLSKLAFHRRLQSSGRLNSSFIEVFLFRNLTALSLKSFGSVVFFCVASTKGVFSCG
jgi:hypothetical protein